MTLRAAQHVARIILYEEDDVLVRRQKRIQIKQPPTMQTAHVICMSYKSRILNIRYVRLG